MYTMFYTHVLIIHVYIYMCIKNVCMELSPLYSNRGKAWLFIYVADAISSSHSNKLKGCQSTVRFFLHTTDHLSSCQVCSPALLEE